MLAYADCNQGWKKGKNIRNLDYRASLDVDKDTSIDIMTAALGADSPDEAMYNNFSPTLLEKLPDDSRIWLAREGSVCIYVVTNIKIKELKLMKLLDANEVDLRNNNRWVRIWWD